LKDEYFAFLKIVRFVCVSGLQASNAASWEYWGKYGNYGYRDETLCGIHIQRTSEYNLRSALMSHFPMNYA